MKICQVIFIIVIILLTGCSQDTKTGNPAWVDKLIKQFESAPVENPPLSVWSYEYDGQIVYFVPAHCCDITSILYDGNGNYHCAPDGGFTGKGDEKCPDLFSERSNEQMVWQDSRTH